MLIIVKELSAKNNPASATKPQTYTIKKNTPEEKQKLLFHSSTSSSLSCFHLFSRRLFIEYRIPTNSDRLGKVATNAIIRLQVFRTNSDCFNTKCQRQLEDV